MMCLKNSLGIWVISSKGVGGDNRVLEQVPILGLTRIKTDHGQGLRQKTLKKTTQTIHQIRRR